jgi:hypothetical protein
MTHREFPGAPVEHQWVVRGIWVVKKMRLTPFVRGRTDDDDVSSYSFGTYGDWDNGPRHLNARFETGQHRVGEDRFIRAGLGGRWPLNRSVELAPAVRWVDPNLDEAADGYWYFYMTEHIDLAKRARLEMALRWQHYEEKARTDRVALRVTLVAS